MPTPQPFLRKFVPFFIILGFVVVGVLVVIATNRTAFFTASNLGTQQSGSKLDDDIAKAEATVAKNPKTAKPYLALASYYLQKVRETSDSAYYAKIDTLMDRAAAVSPTDGDVPAIRASVSMGRHDFQKGKTYIQQALALNSQSSAYYGLDGDADIELGRYSDAVASFQKMVDMRPSFSSWSRIAYIRELTGDIPGAKAALAQAIASGSSYPENIAWSYVELGKLQMRDDLAGAAQSFNMALQVLPTYSQAVEGLGKVAFAKGDLKDAETEFTKASSQLALAQYAIDLGDVYASEKESTKASQQYALALVAFSTSVKGGVNTDLEESLFLSDHDLQLPKALEMATRAHLARPSVYGADYLAWALYKNNNVSAAAALSKEALRLGEIDPLILFHQGMIALANKDTLHAKEYLSKAELLSPHFSIQYEALLKATLASLK